MVAHVILVSAQCPNPSFFLFLENFILLRSVGTSADNYDSIKGGGKFKLR